MSRLQKKCLVATAGTHLLLVVLLLCSGFITSKPQPDETQLLDVIPANVIEAAFNSGVKNAPKPPPTPPEIKPPEPQPQPQPVKQPEPEPVKPEKLPEPDLTPVVKPPKAKIEIDLKPVIRKTPAVSKPADTSAEDAKREKARLQKERLKAIANAARSIKENSSSATTVEMPGTGSVSYASYASVVKSIYEQAWTPPDDATLDDANTKVSVTIASDGRVLNAHILNPSGDAKVDASVRRTLDRVTFVREFPDGAKEKEKTFIINFNLKAKRMSA